MYRQLIIIAIAAFLMQACHNASSEKKTPVAAITDRYPLATVSQHSLSSSIRLPALLEPYQQVSIYPRVNGFVRAVNVDRGSAVRKGQLLLELDAPEIIQQYYAAQSKYLQAKALYASSKDAYERTIQVNEVPGTISPHDIEVVRAKMEADSAIMNSELANFKALEATRSYLTVTAPFDGVITERNIHPGALVGPTTSGVDGKPMLMLEQEQVLRLLIQVPEIYSGQLSTKSELSFQVNALPGRTFTGTISREAGSLNDRYRSEPVEVDVQNGQHLLKAGMYAEVTISVNGSVQAMVVPSSAVVTSTEKKYVVAVRNGETQWITVQEGNKHNDSTEVFGDLKAGDQVVSPATDEIREHVKMN
jgi:membrane fusion protein, multidrug efflux system